MKRRLALLLTMAMGISVLAGCGGGEADTGNDDGAASTEGSAGDGGAAEIDFDEEPYEATLMYWAANDARDLESVSAAFNELTLAELNMKVNLMPLTFGTYTQQIQMILSSDDPLDVFPYWGTNVGSYIDADYLVDMSEYMDTYGQDLVRVIGEEDISCGSLNGFLAGVPNMHERTNPMCFIMRTDLLEETGFTAEDIKTAEDMTQIFAAVHEKHPDITVYGGSNGSSYPIGISLSIIDPLGGGNFGVLPDNGQSTTVENWYESDTFMEACKLV